WSRRVWSWPGRGRKRSRGSSSSSLSGPRAARRCRRTASCRLARLSPERFMDWSAIALSLRLAAIVSAVLLVVGLPIAYWLAFSPWRWEFLVDAIVTLHLLLPPTVLTFHSPLALR